MDILLNEIIEEQRTLSGYLDKLGIIDDTLNKIISKEIVIQSSHQLKGFKNIKDQLKVIDYSTQYIVGEKVKKEKNEQLRISEFQESICLKYYLLYTSLISNISVDEKFELIRILMGLTNYQSTFDRFLRFQDEKLLELINRK